MPSTMERAVPNEYTTIIIDAARSRGLDVDLIDPATGEMILSNGTRSVRCLQSLTERTTALAYLNCTDKVRSREVLSRAGLPLPAGRVWSESRADLDFVEQHQAVVIKPAIGEGGAGVTVGVGIDELVAAVDAARRVHPVVIMEEVVTGIDLRVLIIDDEIVAAAVRKPADVVGDGTSSLAELADRNDLRVDTTMDSYLRRNGWTADDVPPEGEVVQLRGTANVHTGGTITDATDDLSTSHQRIASAAAQAVGAPVVGVDLMVDAVEGSQAYIIEVNEQPGLANHEPHPVAEKFLDHLELT